MPALPRGGGRPYRGEVPFLALGLVLLLPLLAVVLMPFTLVQRYRMGSARRQARGWLAVLNVAAIGLSTAFFLTGAAVTSLWLPGAFTHALVGVGGGGLLGLAGLGLSRWEHGPGTLHYTPNRWLVLGITLVVTARIVYGFWRAWHSWQAGYEGWLAASGAAGALAAGGLVLGYYLVYWTGVRRQVRRLRGSGARS
jgi:hypothetical protein